MAEFEFDVAISFAGPQRDLARKLNELLIARHVKVFYDEFEQAMLWGKDLAIYFDAVYQHKARFCIIIASKAYLERDWTRHELGAALSRAFSERAEYILPVKVDDSDIPGIPRTRGYIDARRESAEKIADLVVVKLLDDTQGASNIYSSRKENRPMLTPEDPEDEPEALALWDHHCQAPEQTALGNTECAWVVPFPRGGISVSDLDLDYDENFALHRRYDEILPKEVGAALEEWARTKPTQFHKLENEPWGIQVRLAGLEFVHQQYKFKVHLSPIKFLYYVAIQARLWSRALAPVRRAAFKNALSLGLTEQESPLMLPSHFAIHMAVVSNDNFLLLRQRTIYTELYPSAWEAGVGEFMHGKDPTTPFPHFTGQGQPNLFLFLKNAIAEEVGFGDARPDDFRVHGFAVEYRTLAPKLLVVYRSAVDIRELIQAAKSAKDSAPKMDQIKMVPEEIARAATSQTYPTWGPTSKLAMILALVDNCSEATRHELLGRVSQYIALARARGSTL